MAHSNTGTTGSTGNQAQGRMSGGDTGTPDATYNLISVLYHALNGAQTYQQYCQDAERSGNQELAQFFREVQEENKRRAQRGRELLARQLQQGQGSSRMSQ